MTILYENICINRQTKHGHLISKISISKDNTTAKIQHTLDGKSFDFLFCDLPTSIHFISSSGSGLLQQHLSTLNIAKQLRTNNMWLILDVLVYIIFQLSWMFLIMQLVKIAILF